MGHKTKNVVNTIKYTYI